MKKSIFLLLLIPMLCFSQYDFRKMNWGDSTGQLLERNSEVDFIKQNINDFQAYVHELNLVGIKSIVIYWFDDDKLIQATYFFKPLESFNTKDSKEMLSDFRSVSKILMDKYNMQREDEWIVSTWRDRPDYLHSALALGDVYLKENNLLEESSNTVINHFLGTDEGDLVHRLDYFFKEFYKKVKAEQEDDF